MSASGLFRPFDLYGLKLANRIVLAPLTRSRAGHSHLPNALMAEYYVQRSSAGLLISEATTISEEANGWNESPAIYTDEMGAGWKLTTEGVHDQGGVIFLQLWHMGRASHSSFHGGNRAVAPFCHQNQRRVHPHPHREATAGNSQGVGNRGDTTGRGRLPPSGGTG